jgi:protein O-mannosyl-transferase
MASASTGFVVPLRHVKNEGPDRRAGNAWLLDSRRLPERLPMGKSKPKRKLHAPPPGPKPVQDALDAGKSQELRMKVMLGVFALALYANTFGNRFAFDDAIVLQGNRFTQQGFAGIPKMLTTFYWAGYWDYNTGLYRPLSLIGFAAQWAFFGNAPAGYHVVSVVLYAITIVLLFGTLRTLLSNYSPIVAFVATLIFAAHPTHTEVVANIKSQDELLCFIFALLTVRLVLTNIHSPSRKSVFFAGACFFLSLLAKESALVFLGAIPLMLYFFRDTQPKALAREMAPLVAVSVLWFALHQWVIHGNAPPLHAYNLDDNSLVGAQTFVGREATAFYTMGRYLLLLIFPHSLSYDYSYNEIPIVSFASTKAIVPLLACAALAFIAIRELKKKSFTSFGILFFFITISMTSNLIVLIGATMADRFLYVPSLGFCIILAYFSIRFLGMPDGVESSPGFANPRFLPVYILLALYSYKTYTRNMDWHDNLSLFMTDVRASPGSARAHYNAGNEMLERFVLPNPDKNADTRKGALRVAVSELDTAVKIDSAAFLYRLTLASAYMYDDNYSKAAEQASVAIAISEADPKPYFVLGSADYSLGKYEDAIKYLTVATDKGLNDESTWNYLGGAYASTSNFEKARDCYEKALRVNPQSLNGYKNLGSAYGNLRQFDKALEVFKRGLDVSPSDPELNQLVGMTYEKLGDTANARRYYGLVPQPVSPRPRH